MTAHALTPSYLRTGGTIDPRRALAFVGIAALHVAALVALLFMHGTQARPQPVAQTLMVPFVTKTQPQAAPEPPSRPEPATPRAAPKRDETHKHTPTPIPAQPHKP